MFQWIFAVLAALGLLSSGPHAQNTGTNNNSTRTTGDKHLPPTPDDGGTGSGGSGTSDGKPPGGG